MYSNAHIFVNPTYQDNFPTTNLEAQSCGTPVITYNTGGSPESIMNPKYVVDQGCLDDIYRILCNICEEKQSSEDYRDNVLKNYSKSIFGTKYLKLYELVLKG